MHIVDRRLNPKGKSLGNRQRFMRRAKAHIRDAVSDALKRRKISEVEGSENISIRSKDLKEPAFNHDREVGRRDFVLPGNMDYRPGDQILKPPSQSGGGGSEGSPDGDGEDSFVFTLTREEFLEVFFEDLKLPNLAKQKLKKLASPIMTRAGYAVEGPPAKLNKVTTMRNSLARRIALSRPKQVEIEELQSEIDLAEEGDEEARARRLRHELDFRANRMRSIAYIDPIDIRYNRHERQPKPTAQAVMFCLMDASASMTEQLKDLAKRFFMLLHVFLTRHYREVDVVFIRHTSSAAEVDEESFFHGRATGGTVVSSALEEMLRVVRERYPVDDWNIYAAQASDGHNFRDDMSTCLELLDKEIVPLCQYFAYIEVGDEAYSSGGNDSLVWSGYERLLEYHAHFAMRRAFEPGDIFPVFHDLFAASGRSS